MFRTVRFRLVALLLLGVCMASAQELWTVQTVAFPDYRQAQDARTELRDHGFDAYTEFTMFEGQQYARVRIGCFNRRDLAQWLADFMTPAYTSEAVVVPFTDGAPAGFCVNDDIGFIKPTDWGVQSQDSQQIIFRVHLAGHTGFVRMRNNEWRLLTEIEPATAPVSGRSLQFEQVTMAGSQVILAHTPGGRRLVCPGQLIWQTGMSAVMERGSLVTACIVEPLIDWSGQ